MNAADKDVIDNFLSAMTGSTMAVRKYGIVINQTTLAEELRKMGVKKSITQVDELTKTQARYNIIMRATKDAQGAALREADGWANQIKSLGGDLRNLGDDMGAKVLAPGVRMIGWLRDGVKWFSDLDDELKTNIMRWAFIGTVVLAAISAFALFGTALLKVIQAVTLFGKAVALIAPAALWLGLIAAAAYLLYTAWTDNWFGIQDKTQAVWGVVEPILSDLWDWLQRSWKWAIKTGGDAWEWITETTWAEKWQDIKGWLTDGWHWTINKVGEGWDWFTNLEVVQKSLAKLKGYWLNFYYWWNGVPAITPEGITSGFDVDQPGFKHKLLEIQKAISDLWERPFEKLEMSVPELLVTAGAATLAAVALWKVLPWVYPGLSMAITKGIGSLAAGGLMLGKVLVAGLTLSLLAGAIGWAFGDKEGRDGFVAAIKESVDSMTFDDPISIPIAAMDIFTLTFDFGADGIRNLREQVQGALDQIKAWDPAETDAPEWLSDIGGSLWGLALSLSEFMTEGLLLTFDLYELMVRAIEKALLKPFQPFIDFGKSIGQWIVDGILGILPEWAKNWLGIETKTPEPGVMPPAAVAPPGVDIVTGGAPVAIRQITEQERQMLAAIAYLEDGVNGVQAMTADIEVIFNRMDMNPAQYGATIEEVIRKAGQFEPVGRGLFDTLLASGNIPDEAFEAVDQALINMANNTQLVADALYFANLDIVRQRHEAAMAAGNTYAGSWMLDPTKMEPVLVLGDTTYGKKGPNYGKYSSGTPWTGSGPIDEIAGLVHKQEAVIPWKVLKNGGLAVLDFLGMPGFAEGRLAPGVGGGTSGFNWSLLVKTVADSVKDAISTGLETVLGEELYNKLTSGFDNVTKEIKGLMDDFGKIQEEIDKWKNPPEPEPLSWKDVGGDIFENIKQAFLNQVPALENAMEAYRLAIEAGQSPIQAFTTSVATLFMSTTTFQEILETLAYPLRVLFEVLGQALRPLIPVVQLMGKVITWVAETIVNVWNSLIDVLDFIWIFGSLQHWKLSIEEAEEAAKRQTGAVDKATEAMRNVPQGLKLVWNRMDSSIPQDTGPIRGSSGTTTDLQAFAMAMLKRLLPGLGSEIHNHFHGDVYGMDDFDRRVNEVTGRTTRANNLVRNGV